MAIELPREIRSYFEKDRERSAEAIAACFTPDAIVRDEGKTYHGHDAIRRWRTESTAKYTYTAEPFAIDQVADRLVVTSHVAGDFSGSPVDLRYTFLLNAGKISELEITA